MYEQFYGFQEKPFNVTPDTKFFFSSEKHEEALNSLRYAIEERKGFVVVTGEIGSGKTTVWHALINQLPRSTKVALITNTHLTAKQMLMAILDELEVTYKEHWSKVKLLNILNNYLIDQILDDCHVVLILDEAQNLSRKVLEEVRMLSNLETEKEKLIQIILMGQPELKDIFASKALEQLRQRIAVYYHLTPLNKQETDQYISHRLGVSGSNGSAIFDAEALELIYRYSDGVPRRINTLCDRALLTGFLRDRKPVTGRIVEEVAAEIEELAPAPAPRVQNNPQPGKRNSRRKNGRGAEVQYPVMAMSGYCEEGVWRYI
ncbi:MAG: AAA family ATPase [Candidatus Omnitrophica bacterium]|nr:AAA family ATPase [Candidatus Omnitrophota bacterium]